MNKIYPLKFKPTPKERVWGGKNLNNTFEIEIPDNITIGESLDLCGIEGESSIISNGFLAENELEEIIETYMGEIIGDDKYQTFGNQLPIIIKKLDIEEYLSVQVHPDDEIAIERHECFGKSELWYIKDCKPEARLYIGFNKETTASEVYEKCQDGSITDIMCKIIPQKGEYYMIKPGCTHTAGGGVEIIEISQASDITYRLYDWNRNSSNPRETHLDICLDVIDYTKYNLKECRNLPKEHLSHIVNSSHFIVNHLILEEEKQHISVDKYRSFITYTVAKGNVEIESDSKIYELKSGETILIPASIGDIYISKKAKQTELIECYLPSYPNIEEDADAKDINPSIHNFLS